MIFIAYDQNGVTTSIVNAKSEELALAYWQGADVDVFSHKSLDDFMDLNNHPTGVYPILKTKNKSLSGFGKNPENYIIVLKY